MISTRGEDDQKSDAEVAFSHGSCKFTSSFFLQIEESKSHILVSF